VSKSFAACGSTAGMHMEPAGWFAVDAAAAEPWGARCRNWARNYASTTHKSERPRNVWGTSTPSSHDCMHHPGIQRQLRKPWRSSETSSGVSIRSVLSCDEELREASSLREQQIVPLQSAEDRWSMAPSKLGPVGRPEASCWKKAFKIRHLERKQPVGSGDNKQGTGSAASRSCRLVSP
jgi:hypothetical protein